jgi:hypothetical protein
MAESSGSISFVGRFEVRYRVSRYGYWTAKFCVLFFVSLIAGLQTHAQTLPPQRVYGSTTTPTSAPPTDVVGFSKDSTTGGLTGITGSPFPERLEGGAMAVDGQGKFLFVINPTSNDISMFQIDQTTGALLEVPGSPFAYPAPAPPSTAPAPSGLLSIATERSGQFVFVGYRYYSSAASSLSAIASFAIDISTPSNPVLKPRELDGLIPVAPYTNIGTPIQLLTDSKGLHLYVGTGLGYGSTVSGGALVYAIQTSGHLVYQGVAASLPSYGTAYAIDPLDRFFYGVGGDVPFIVPCVISPVDGTATYCTTGPLQYLGFTNNQFGMQIEGSGYFLYIASNANLVVFSIDQTTGVATQVSTVSGIFPAGGTQFITDPIGPYLYSAQNTSPGAIHTYQVNLSTGNLTEISGSSVTMTVQCCQSLAITGNLPLPVNGPGASISPSSAAAFSATGGGTSAAQAFSIVNVGNQMLTFTSISIAGTDASSFSETNTCTASLAPNANCSISITFNPGSAGTFTANLQIADNAGDSPQTLALSGTAVAPVPSVTLAPNSLSFSQIAQGATEGPLAITVTNNGTGPLHVTSATFGGPNPNDFSQTNTCVGTPVAVNGTCTINVSFTPIAPGGRTATLTINDDAPSGTQSVSLQGTATSPFQLGPSGSSTSTSATVTAGQTANYSLQISPGAGFTGNVALTCSGAPALATCAVSPTSLNITNANAVPFTVSVMTTGSAAVPVSIRNTPFANWRLHPAIVAWLILLMILRMNGTKTIARRLSYVAALSVLALLLVASGCGGGSTTSPQQQVTPKGTYTLTVTATANNLPAQTMSLTLTVN